MTYDETMERSAGPLIPAQESYTESVAAAIDAVATAIDWTLAMMRDLVRRVNVANGWFDDTRTIGDDLMLLVTEVAEAMEEYREHGFEYGIQRRDTGERSWADDPEVLAGIEGKPLGFASELADVLVRLLDTAYRTEVDLGAAFRLKLRYNATRGYKHGGKKL